VNLRAAVADPRWAGFGPVHVVARRPFWDEDDLPFTLHGGGAVVRLEPARGFAKDLLAGSADERAVVADCPDAPGWLVPAGIVADWMDRHVSCPALDDLLLSHPLYSYATATDRRGSSRMGRGRLAHWSPGMPTLASLAAPDWLPDDPAAPLLHRDREAHADAVADLLEALDGAFGLLEAEVPSRYVPAPRRRSPSRR
jgi:hypothetical protein